MNQYRDTEGWSNQMERIVDDIREREAEERLALTACSAWRDAPPDSPGPWLEWTGYTVKMWEVESRPGTSEVWIYWNSFYRMCSEIQTASKWAKIIAPNAGAMARGASEPPKK